MKTPRVKKFTKREMERFKKDHQYMMRKLKKVNGRSTEKLSNRQLNQLAKYTYECLTTGRHGTFRWLIYDVLNPAVGYCDGMYLGLLNFNNVLCDIAGRMKDVKPLNDKKECEHDFEEWILTEDGLYYRECSKCYKEELSDGVSIGKKSDKNSSSLNVAGLPTGTSSVTEPSELCSCKDPYCKHDQKPSLALRLMRVMYSTPEAMLTSDRIESVADEARKWAISVVERYKATSATSGDMHIACLEIISKLIGE